MTGLRLILLLLFARVVRCDTKSNVSPGATVTVNEYGSGVTVVMSVLVNCAVPLCLAINRTLPGSLYSCTVPETTAVPPNGATHRKTASLIVPELECLNPPFQIARYNSSPDHFDAPESYVILAPDESR